MGTGYEISIRAPPLMNTNMLGCCGICTASSSRNTNICILVPKGSRKRLRGGGGCRRGELRLCLVVQGHGGALIAVAHVHWKARRQRRKRRRSRSAHNEFNNVRCSLKRGLEPLRRCHSCQISGAELQPALSGNSPYGPSASTTL